MGFYRCSIFSELWSIASWHWCIGSCHCGDMYSSEGTSGLVLCAAARLVLGLPGCAPVSAAMHDKLHWLSFPQRVMFESCLLTYKCLHGLAPCSASARYWPLFLAVLCYVQLTQTNCWYHGPARPALYCVPSFLLVWLPGMICRLICATLSDFRQLLKPLCSRLFQCSYRARLCDNLLIEHFEMSVYYYYYYYC